MFPSLDHELPKAEHGLVFFNIIPVEPTDLIVLAVGIIVTQLSATDLITHHHHGHPLRHQENCRKVLHLTLTEIINPLISCFAFNTTIPAQVFVNTVVIAFTICFVMLFVVGNHIVKSETVVSNDKIHTIDRQVAAPLIQVSTARQAIGHLTQKARITLDKATNGIAILTVPLGPTVARKITNLIQPSRIPSFGNHLAIGQNIIQFNGPDNRRML